MSYVNVWTIAGVDSSGGAGITADAKTIGNLGAKACTVVTAVTAQNSAGVHVINPVGDNVIDAQIQALEEEFPPAVIKIGMLVNASQVKQVAAHIQRLKTGNEKLLVVYDPVLISSSGGALYEDNIVPAVQHDLLPLVDVLTPNANEVDELCGVSVRCWQDARNAASALSKMGCGAVVIKGGHIDVSHQYSVDFCLHGEQEYWLASERIATTQRRGTGCTFASAMAVMLASGYLLRDAFTVAKAYINQGLATVQAANQADVWQGMWPDNPTHYPQVLVNGSELALKLNWASAGAFPNTHNFASHFAVPDTQRLGLYPVVDSVEWLERLLALGVTTLQYREKRLTGMELERAIQQAVILGKRYNARLFINDHWQLAIKHRAYGVHLGQEDLAEADLSAIKQASLKLGVSTHGHYELLKAMVYQPSYLAIGAIFPTRTKDMTGQIQGVETLSRLLPLCPHYPVVAIGGITLDNARKVLNTGVGSIAVVTAVTEAADVRQVVNNFNRLLDA